MEDAKISENGSDQQQTQPNPFTYNNRYPSIVDSDDIVFELGKQIVDKVNKEKLLEGILKKSQETEKTFLVMKEKFDEFQKSNMSYQENNKRLDKETVSLRETISELKVSINNKDNELEEMRSLNKDLNDEIEDLKNPIIVEEKEEVQPEEEEVQPEEEEVQPEEYKYENTYEWK